MSTCVSKSTWVFIRYCCLLSVPNYYDAVNSRHSGCNINNVDSYLTLPLFLRYKQFLTGRSTLSDQLWYEELKRRTETGGARDMVACMLWAHKKGRRLK
jgi:hypothetical protein